MTLIIMAMMTMTPEYDDCKTDGHGHSILDNDAYDIDNNGNDDYDT